MVEVVEVDPHDEPASREDWETEQAAIPAVCGQAYTQLTFATLAILQRDHPDRRTVHTWTDPDHTAMYRTNVRLGYVATERMHEMQRKDGG